MVSQLDIAPTIARVLGIEVSTHGRPIEGVECWGCRDAILIIADSFGWSLYFSFLTHLRQIPIKTDSSKAPGFLSLFYSPPTPIDFR